MATAAIGVFKTVTGFLSGLWGGTPQDFDVLKRGAFLPFAVNKAATSGIPVLFCWFNAMVKVMPDGAFFTLAVVDNCFAASKFEDLERAKGDIWAVRCTAGTKVTSPDPNVISSGCSFVFLKGPGIVETVVDIVKDFTGFDSTGVVPDPRQIPTPTDTTVDIRPEDATVKKAGFQLPGGAGIALAAVGLLLVFAFSRGR